MGAEVRYRLRIAVTFEYEADWDAVTRQAAFDEFMACVEDGAFGVSEMQITDAPPTFRLLDAKKSG